MRGELIPSLFPKSRIALCGGVRTKRFQFSHPIYLVIQISLQTKIKNDSRFVRPDAPRGSISSIGKYLANRFRSLRFRMECATRQICFVAASTKRIDSERIQPQLEVSSGIRFPAILTHSSVPIQDQAGQSRSDPHLPNVAVTGQVSHPPADGNRYPTHFPAEPLSHPLAQAGAASPPPVRQIYADRIAVIRGGFKKSGNSIECYRPSHGQQPSNHDCCLPVRLDKLA